MSDCLQPYGLYSQWTSPGQNTGVGSLSLLWGIFLTQELNQGLLHCWRILYQLSHQGSPVCLVTPPLKNVPLLEEDRGWGSVIEILERMMVAWCW